MRRSTYPTEIMLGFAAGALAAFFVEQPVIWLLHHLGLTSRDAWSMVETLPMGVHAWWSRVFWGCAWGIALAWFGTRYPLGAHHLGMTTLFAAGVRTIADWFVVPMFYNMAWAGWRVDGLITPVIANFTWGIATAVLVAAFSLAAGTWGAKSIALR